jgi:hypothetical protein
MYVFSTSSFHHFTVSSFQHRFLVNVTCVHIGYQLTETFSLEGCLKSKIQLSRHSVFEHDNCHRMSRRMQALYMVKLLYPGTQYSGHCATWISHTTSYHFIWKNFLQARSVAAIRQRSTSFHWSQSTWIGAVNAIELVVGLTCQATPLTALDLLLTADFDVAWRSWCIRRHRRRGMSSCGASCTVSLLHKTIMTTYRKQHVLLLNELACA